MLQEEDRSVDPMLDHAVVTYAETCDGLRHKSGRGLPPPPPPPSQQASTHLLHRNPPGPPLEVEWLPFPSPARLLLCLRYNGDCKLLQHAVALSQDVLQCHSIVEHLTNAEISNRFKQHSWGGNHAIPALLQPTSGPFLDQLAIGIGPNVKKRKRCGWLALTLTVAVDNVQHRQKAGSYHPSFGHLVAVAHRKRQSALQGIGEGFFEDKLQPGPTALPSPGRLPAETTPPYQSPPQACVRDPFTEMRVFPCTKDMWPWCTACSCWSDLYHLNSKKHRKHLCQDVSHQGSSQRQLQASSLGVTPRQAPPPPTSEQIYIWGEKRIKLDGNARLDFSDGVAPLLMRCGVL